MENLIILVLWIAVLCGFFCVAWLLSLPYHWYQERKEAEKRITEGFFNYK